MSNVESLQRVNKVTTVWDGDGVAVGTYYKTKEKMLQLRSDSQEVVEAGFVFPEHMLDSDGVTQLEASGSVKLNAFKEFLQNNATVFGYFFDPVDRRSEKYPSKYNEETFIETSADILSKAIEKVIPGVDKHVKKAIENEQIPYGELEFEIGEGLSEIEEMYKDGESIKYASVIYPVTFSVGQASTTTEVTVQLVSGQMKKPKHIADGINLTITGIKKVLIDGGVLPKPSTKKNENFPDKSKDSEIEEVDEMGESAEYIEE